MRDTYIVTFYFGEVNGKKNMTSSSSYPGYMCKPETLKILAYSHKAIFCMCEKYGCREFNPWPNGIRPAFYADFCSFPKI